MKKTLSLIVATLAVTGVSTAAHADEAPEAMAAAVATAGIFAPLAPSAPQVARVSDEPDFDLRQVTGSVVNDSVNNTQFRIEDFSGNIFARDQRVGFNRVAPSLGQSSEFRDGTGLDAVAANRPAFGELSTELEGANQRAIGQHRSASIRFSL